MNKIYTQLNKQTNKFILYYSLSTIKIQNRKLSLNEVAFLSLVLSTCSLSEDFDIDTYYLKNKHRIYSGLQNYNTKYFFYSESTTADILNLSIPTIHRIKMKLIEADLIIQVGDTNHLDKANVYIPNVSYILSLLENNKPNSSTKRIIEDESTKINNEFLKILEL